MSNLRQHAHHLIDRLAEPQLAAVISLLETTLDPVGRALCDAPFDDEPEDEEERHAVTIAREWLSRHGGQGIPHAEAMRRLGFA